MREAWLASRREVPHSVGASEVAAILGGAWGGEHEVWSRRVLGREPRRAAELDGGHGAEPYVAAWATAQLRLERVRHGHAAPWVDRDPEAPWAACSPDLVGERQGRRVGVELKTSGSPSGWPAAGRVDVDGLPHGYGWQVLWQFGASGLDEAYLAAWLGAGAHLWRLYQVRATRAQYLEARARVAAWRQAHLIDGHEPPGEPGQELDAARARARPGAEAPEGTAAQAAEVAAWLTARATESAATLERERAEARLLRACPSGARFADGAIVVTEGRRPKWVAARK